MTNKVPAAPVHDPAKCEAPKPCAECLKAKEANSASATAALDRPIKKESVSGAFKLGTRFIEAAAAPDDVSREVPVLIIKEGMGNAADRHFYTRELLVKIAPMFDGVKAYANHPSKTEESDRPERDVRDIVGYYYSPEIVTEGGKSAIRAILKINEGSAFDWVWALVKEAAAFTKKFKNKDLIGISINAWGQSHQEDSAALGGVINVVDDLTEVQSADIVTQAGAGGGFRLREAVQKLLQEENVTKIKEGGLKSALKAHGEALSAIHAQMLKDPKVAEAYGPAMEALMKGHTDLMAAAPEPEKKEGASGQGGANPNPGEEPEVTESDRKAAEGDFEAMRERYESGKMTATEKVLFEKLSEAKVAEKARVHKEMVSKKIAEASIPADYSDDIPTLCLGKDEAGVSKIVEARKKLVESILGPGRATGAGAGGGGEKKPSKLSEKVAALGVGPKA